MRIDLRLQGVELTAAFFFLFADDIVHQLVIPDLVFLQGLPEVGNFQGAVSECLI